MKFLNFILLVLILVSMRGWATPAQVVIVRHGEKPAVGNELNQRGCERAYLLPKFFLSNPTIERFGRPAGVYAAAPTHPGSSVRAIETIAPTAQALNLAVRDPATREQYSVIVPEILSNPAFDGKTVLMAWEHGAIPGLARAFGANLPASMAKWPNRVFDQAWVLRFSGSSAPDIQVVIENVFGSNAPDQVVNECTDNSTLNQIAAQITNPPVSL